MTDGFVVTENGDDVTVQCENFSLVFNKLASGITSFKYLSGGNWHEGVETSDASPVMFGSYFSSIGVTGGVLYPVSGNTQTVEINLPWCVQIKQVGYLRNGSLPSSTDFPYVATWRVWPSGKIACKIESKNNSGSLITLDEEAYRLNPSDDADITLGRDTAPNFNWLGFWSDNTGDNTVDLSHDGILLSYATALDEYGSSGHTNRIYDADVPWSNAENIVKNFFIALSIDGGWGDVTDSSSFETHGDDLSDDMLNADPLDGSTDAGDVITGSKVGSGFDEYTSCYTLSA